MTLWKDSLKTIDAKKIADGWDEQIGKGEDPFASFSITRGVDAEIREKLWEFYEEFESFKAGYLLDFEFGIRMYVYLNGLGMNESVASNDDVWRHLQMRVVPDLIYNRWVIRQNKEGEVSDLKINAKRFYSEPSRIYLKVLWWYIHILWAGTEEETRGYSDGIVSIDISQVIDRAGRNGTRVGVYKEILHMYSRIDPAKRPKIETVMTLNLYYCESMEPELAEGGLQGYVLDLFRELNVDV